MGTDIIGVLLVIKNYKSQVMNVIGELLIGVFKGLQVQ